MCHMDPKGYDQMVTANSLIIDDRPNFLIGHCLQIYNKKCNSITSLQDVLKA